MLRTTLGAAGVAALCTVGAVAEEHPSISGRYPHLTIFSDSLEVGIGAVVDWQDQLYVITYSPNAPEGSSDKLHIIDYDLNHQTYDGSVGGTPANRLIHRESNQLFIGPYAVDEHGDIRTIPMGSAPTDAEEGRIYGRITATARHLLEPEDKVYHFDMEGILYEVDVNTLDLDLLYNRAVPGWHAKGAYTGQGRFVIANNGEWSASHMNPFRPFDYQIPPRQGHEDGVCPQCGTQRCGVTRTYPENAGALADWNGRDYWRMIKRRQFTEVTGPGGIYGNQSDDDPVWAIGWDRRSLLLMILDDRQWHTFRLPKADYSYEGHHGWHTEWPRIREAVPANGDQAAKILMNKNGAFFDVPEHLNASDTSGLAPMGSYLKILSDTQAWHDGRIVFASNETSRFDNPMAGQAQSNLWFSSWDELGELGAPVGWGGVWMEDDITAGIASDPMLIGGYEQRVLHLAHQSGHAVAFDVDVDPTGRGDWQTYQRVEVPAEGYTFHVIDDALDAQWLRITPTRDASGATAYLHMGISQGATEDPYLFEALADVDDESPWVRAIGRPRGADMRNMHLVATGVNPDGSTSDLGHYQMNGDLNLVYDDDSDAAEYLRDLGEPNEHGTAVAPDSNIRVDADDASVIVYQGDKRFRLPRSHEAYDQDCPAGERRAVREVVTERALLNTHGTFYVLPRNNSGGVRALKPIATHNKRISDWFSYRGMLVLLGTNAGADASHPHYVAADNGQAGLWVGDLDDLWKLGKPRGFGGPWHETDVEAGVPSDAYLMTGYDSKRVQLSHDADQAVTFTLEVDIFGAIDTPQTWHTYEQFTVEPGQTLDHVFPEGFAAHWVRVISDADTTATAMFVYE